MNAKLQQMLGMENLVNAILALECNCATVDRIAELRGEIAKVLPGRTDNAIKNRYNSNQRRQLRMQRRAEAVAAGRLPPSKPGPPKAPASGGGAAGRSGRRRATPSSAGRSSPGRV